jgi:hypothetical protein
MDKKMLSIVLAVVLIGCFFLDWGSGSGTSGFNIVKGAGPWEKYVLILIPLSGALLLVGALNNGNYPLGRNLLCWLPLLAVLFWIFIAPLITPPAMKIGDIFKGLGKGWGIGWWITIAASLVLALFNPKGK